MAAKKTKTPKPEETESLTVPPVSFDMVEEVKQKRDSKPNPFTALVTAITAEGIIDTRGGAAFNTTDKLSTVAAQLKRAADAAGVDLRKTVSTNEDGSLHIEVRAVTRKKSDEKSDVNGI